MIVDSETSAKELASRECGIPMDQLGSTTEQNPSLFWVWQKLRGGIRFLVASDGSFMVAGSAPSRESVLQEFARGRRTKPEQLSLIREQNLLRYGPVPPR